MSIYISIVIMIITGLLGGLINYLLPANEVDGKKKMKWTSCIVIGVGATLLVPLFLQIAQSRILENMHDGWAKTAKMDIVVSQGTPLYKLPDTASEKKESTAITPEENRESGSLKSVSSAPGNPFQGYLLFIAYCLLASTAGYRFINVLIDSVVKEEKLTKLINENNLLSKENEKRTANNQRSQQQEHVEIKKQIIVEMAAELKMEAAVHHLDLHKFEIPFIPELPPVQYPGDPQKGRFGGRSKNNFRILDGEVSTSDIPKFYKVKLWVGSTDPVHHPLNSDVIFYIHDSFSPSVFSYKPAEFINGKAIEDKILSYGAFTVGIITDNGKTMLELDLSRNPGFPKEFRER